MLREKTPRIGDLQLSANALSKLRKRYFDPQNDALLAVPEIDQTQPHSLATLTFAGENHERRLPQRHIHPQQ